MYSKVLSIDIVVANQVKTTSILIIQFVPIRYGITVHHYVVYIMIIVYVLTYTQMKICTFIKISILIVLSN